jgi:hypothetical protein
MRANEKFSGKGHARHLCKDCARLGKEELAYRQEVRNLERMLTWEGAIRRRCRQQFRKYLEHENERVRAYALEIEARIAWEAAEQRLARELDDLSLDLENEGIVPLECGYSSEFVFEDDDDVSF